MVRVVVEGVVAMEGVVAVEREVWVLLVLVVMGVIRVVLVVLVALAVLVVLVVLVVVMGVVDTPISVPTPPRGRCGRFWSRPRAGHLRLGPSTSPCHQSAGHTNGSHPKRCSSPS